MKQIIFITTIFLILLISCQNQEIVEKSKELEDDTEVGEPEIISIEKDSKEYEEFRKNADLESELDDKAEEKQSPKELCSVDECKGDNLNRCILKRAIYEIDCPYGCKNGKCKEKESKNEEFNLEFLSIGMNWGNDYKVLTQGSISSFEKKYMTVDSSNAEYSQSMKLTTDGVDGGTIVFSKNNEDKLGDYLYFNDGDVIMEHTLTFSRPLQSTIESKKLKDYVGERIQILGEEFQIINAEIDTNENSLSLEMIGAGQEDILEEGASKEYKVNDIDVFVDVLSIDENKNVRLSVNGENTGKMKEGDVKSLSFGISIGVKDILPNENLDGKDLVVFNIGGKKVKLLDGDYSDDDFSDEVKYDGNSVSNAKVLFRGSVSGTKFRLIQLSYRLISEGIKPGGIYLGINESLSDHLEDPYSMLSNNWDVKYLGLASEESTSIEFNQKGSGYELEFVNLIGDKFNNIPFIDGSGDLKFGNEDVDLHYTEGSSSTDFYVDKGDYVLLTDRNDRKGDSYILKFDRVDTGNNKVIFDNPSGGKEELTYNDDDDSNILGSGTLEIHSNKFKVFVNNDANKISMSLNDDESVDGDKTDLVVKGGGVIVLDNAISGDTANVTLKTESRRIKDSLDDELLVITFKKSGSSVDGLVEDQDSVDMTTSGGDASGATKFGVLIDVDEDDKIDLDYPEKQRFSNVIVQITT